MVYHDSVLKRYSQEVIKMTNKRFLKSKMKWFGDTNNSLSLYLGISESAFSAKMNHYKGAEFRQGEIEKICKKYRLTESELHSIFFAQ